MKNLSVIFLLLIFISCGEKKQPEPTSLWDAGEYTNSEEKLELPKTKSSDWDKFEAEVFQSIDAVKNADSTNRYTRLQKFISYADRVDGAVAESYSNFAFDYANNNYTDFYSVLNIADTNLVSAWAYQSSIEATLGIEQKEEAKSFLKSYTVKYQLKIDKLPEQKKQLGKFYLKHFSTYFEEAMSNYFTE